MTVTYHAGRRIQGTQADFDGIPAISGGWKEIGRSTLESAGDTITVSSLDDKRYYMILGDISNTGGDTVSHLLANSDGSGNYALSRGVNGTEKNPSIGTNRFMSTHDSKSVDSRFVQGYIANKSDKEKLGIFNVVENPSTGAGITPSRIEGVGKHVQTSIALNKLQLFNDEAGSFDTGGELVVLGYDPDDTHTTNFWEELASVSNTTTQDNNSTGTFTAKKYLWVQMWLKATGVTNTNLSLNNVITGTPYAVRESEDGASDYALTSQNSMTIGTIKNNHSRFINMFIVNNGSNEPLCVGHYVDANTAGAGTAPKRAEFVFKSSNTTQITEIDTDNSGGGSYTAFECKVWGSN